MPSVLVTGASRGIGRAITTHLASVGWNVVAGVRRPEDQAALARIPHVTALILDVTDESHIAALPDRLPRLDAVVNNAGVSAGGPIEAMDAIDMRRVLEVNVVGQLAVTKAVLPRLRESRGRIVFISSTNGRIAAPLLGAYSASKFALESAADSLRMELKPWHIAVSIVEPAQTDTDMWRGAVGTIDATAEAMSVEHRALYARHLAGMRESLPKSVKIAADPGKVANVVERALTVRRPHARYAVGAGPALQMSAAALLPSRLRDAILRKAFRQP